MPKALRLDRYGHTDVLESKKSNDPHSVTFAERLP
jgi:hypothetical protein